MNKLSHLTTQLKDRTTFEQAIHLTPISTIFARLFAFFAALMLAFFILPFLWVSLTGDISTRYDLRINAKIGNALVILLGFLSLTCYLIGKAGRKKLLDRLHQAYLIYPQVYTQQVLLRRNNAVLCAFAKERGQQLHIETLLKDAIQNNPTVRALIYAELYSTHRRHKTIKMEYLKESRYPLIPGLDRYNFYLDLIKWPSEQGETLYTLNFKSDLPAFYNGYSLLGYKFLQMHNTL